VHHANHFYGHAHVLARYAGVAGAPRIWGYLQHGWNLHDGFAVGTAFAPGYPVLVWAEVVARRARAAGHRLVEVVGAPWAYLLRIDGATVPDAEREGTIAYPFHGWEGQRIHGSHTAYARELRAVEGDVPITVCLYWTDFEDERVRRPYEEAGFRVVTHGRRGHMWRGTDPDFLVRQLAELRRHRRVVSNRLGSALLYGASTGAEVGVYGDPMVIENDHAVLGGMEKQLRLFPELHQVRVPPEVALHVARDELGLGHLMPAAELRRVLGWTDAERVAVG
jgi:hypothetical protein